MEELVRDPKGVLISRIRFVIGISCIFLLAAANAIHTAPENPMQVLFIHILLLTGCMIVVYLAPSVVFRALPVVYGVACFSAIAGTLFGNDLPLGPALLPLFALSIPDGWKPRRVILFSLPGLTAVTILRDRSSLIQFGLCLCAILYLSEIMNEDDEDDEDTDECKDPAPDCKKTILHTVLLIVFVGFLLAAIMLYTGRVVETSVQPLLWIASILLIHTSIHLSLHIMFLPFVDITGQSHAPAAIIACTSLLTIVTSLSATYAFIDISHLLGLAAMLASIYRRYDWELQFMRACEADQNEDDEMIQNLF